jgi:geranylgeranylglycerol-phosphate geranylgeranyltransferase
LSAFWGRLLASITLTRPVNCILTALSVWVGALTSGHAHATGAVALAAASAAAIAGSGNALNDVLDLAVDRVNRPDRPLPAGRLSPKVALALAGLLGMAGLGAAFAVGMATGVVALAVVVGLALYNWWWKRIPGLGNVLVGILAAATFPYGAAAAGGGGRWWVPACFALVYHLGREIVKGVEDLEGDRADGVRTLALQKGSLTASRLAAVLFGGVALSAPVPGLTGLYGGAYLAPVTLLVLFLLRVVHDLWSGRHWSQGRLSRRLLLGMALGLVAVVLGESFDRPLPTSSSIP